MANRYALALGLLAALACASEAKLGVELPASLENLNNDNLLSAIANPELAFTRFLEEHGKSYAGNEFLHRLRVFERNLVVAVENQLNDPSAVHGVTRFFDLTEDEFATKYLGLKIPAAFNDHPAAPILPTDQLPSEFDWRTKGAVTPIKNQGICGSCYAFSAIGALEGAHFLATGELLRLSEQQVVDCDHQCDPDYYSVCDSGCMGGLMNNVFKYVIEAGGVVLEKDYPYTGKEGTCKFNDANKVAASVKSYSVVSVEEKQIEANLVKYGPLSIAINAAWMQTYVKGVSCPAVCNKRALNHGVLLVGYGTDGYAPARLRKKDYWIIKNSWGPNWGEEGFYKICSGRNMCGIQNMVSAVVATTLSTPEMADSVVADSVEVA